MKLLLDENLSPRLVPQLTSLFPGITHVSQVGLKQASDAVIWEFAKSEGFTIVTADRDFVAMSDARGCPPKVVHLGRCDYPARVIEDGLRRNAIFIAEFHEDRNERVLTLNVSTR